MNTKPSSPMLRNGLKKQAKRKSLFDFMAELNASAMGKECNINHSLFSTSDIEMFAIYHDEIIAAALKNNIDGRAITGVISWEYRQNPKGRLSDYLQVIIPTKNMGIGWGSIHDEPFLNASLEEEIFVRDRICDRLDASSSIEKVGHIMGEIARDFYRISGGVWINDSPEILAFYYNTGKAKIRASAHRLVEKNHGSFYRLEVSRNEMANWINKNLSDFEFYKTTTTLPQGFYVKAISDLHKYDFLWRPKQ